FLSPARLQQAVLTYYVAAASNRKLFPPQSVIDADASARITRVTRQNINCMPGAHMKITLRLFFSLALVCAALSHATAQASGTQIQAAGQATTAPVVGNYQGALSVNGTKLRIGLKVTQVAGQLAATLDSPDQGANDLPLEHVAYADRILSFDLDAGAPAHYEGAVSRDGTEIAGHLRQ